MEGKKTGLMLGIIFLGLGIFLIIFMAEQPLSGTTLPYYVLVSLTFCGGFLLAGIAFVALYFKNPHLLDELFRQKKKIEKNI